MSRPVPAAVCAAWLCLGGAAIAHHSVGINFDASKAFSLTGVLKELDIRNPHSQITLSVKGADGTVKDWFHLGRSAGHWEGDTLVIESTDLKAGLLDSLGDPGLWQSDQMQTVERFVPNGNRMQVIVWMTDPVHFVEPFTTTFNYLKLPDGQLLTWDCVPEEAGYNRFNENAPRQPLPLRNNPQ